MIFAEMRGERSNEHCIAATALAYEIDGRLLLDRAIQRVIDSRREAILWTTHNHMRTSQGIPWRRFQEWHIKKFGRKGAPTDATVAQYCAESNRLNHLRNVRLHNGGEIYRVREYGMWIEVFSIAHDPEHKCRVVFPLEQSIHLKSGECSIADFKALYHAHGNTLFGDAYSRESCNPARIHYLPSHKPGEQFCVYHNEGSLTDPRKLVQRVIKSKAPIRVPQTRLASATLTELATVLESIPADLEYPDWFKAIAAIFHETGGSGEGNELAHLWSSGDPRYDFEQVECIWDSLDPDHSTPSTMGTLVKLARDHDPTFKPASMTRAKPALLQLSAPAVGSDWRQFINKSGGVA
jgi:hypothetical protein